LVGRRAELALLAQHLMVDREGTSLPPVLLLAGEPGIGKTRLLQEAAHQGRAAGWAVLDGGCHHRGGQEPYAPLLGALERCLERMARSARRGALQGCAWLARLLPELTADGLAPTPPWTLTPEQERRLMFKAVARFLNNVAEQGVENGSAMSGRGLGTLLVLDDLQWAGPDALDLLDTLVRSEMTVPLRVVAAYRDTETHAQTPLSVALADLAHAGLALQRTLGPLRAVEAAHLLETLIEEQETTPARLVRERVLQRAGGVPFFLVSWAQAQQPLLRDEGPAARKGAPRDVPWDVAQGVRQRVAALPEAAREVLGAAAVVGRAAPRSLLASVVACSAEETLSSLETACHAHLLEEAGEHAYQFVHDVVREVVESDLGAARRAVLHQRIAAALERAYGVLSVEEIGYHYACTEMDAEAALWLERAGDHAAASFANAAALEHYAAARQRLHAGDANKETLSRLDEKRGTVHTLLGEYQEAQAAFAAARTHAMQPARRAELWRAEGLTWERRGDYAQALAALGAAEAEGGTSALPSRMLAAVEERRGAVHFRRGELDAAAAAAARARALLSEEAGVDAGLVLARADHLQGNVAYMRGALAEAEEGYRRSLAIRERIGDQQGLADSWNNLGNVASDRGDLTLAEQCYRQSLTIRERIGDQQGLADSWTNLGVIALDRGDLAQAEQCYRQDLAIEERIGRQQGIARAWSNLGEIACARGELRTAALRCRQARRLAERIGAPDLAAFAAVEQARTRLRAGWLRAAEALLRHARTLAAMQGLWLPALHVALLTAELRLAEGQLEEAQQTAAGALQLASDGHLRREEAVARRLLGRCALRRGAPGEAETHLRAALVVATEARAALDVARIRLALAEAVLADGAGPTAMDAARALLAEARAQFAATGAALDLAEAERVAGGLQVP
jgi:tetratricopeptide (TPR) repeat protein